MQSILLYLLHSYNYTLELLIKRTIFICDCMRLMCILSPGTESAFMIQISALIQSTSIQKKLVLWLT